MRDRLIRDRRSGLTTRATCLLAAGITALLCGVLFGEQDLVRAGLFAAAIPGVAALFAHRSQLRIDDRRSIEPVDAHAGEKVSVALTITNKSVLPTGALMLEDALPDRVRGKARFVLDPLSGNESRTVTYRLPHLHRGRYRIGPLRVRVRDPFRMIDLTRSLRSTDEFVVSPILDRLPPSEPPRSDDHGDNIGSRSIGSYGADDQSTREYRTGDDLRKIHWKSSARTGALMVRQEERPWQGHITLLLDTRAAAHQHRVGEPESDPRSVSSLEWAVSAVASIGAHVLSAGRKLGLLTDESRSVESTFADPVKFGRLLADVSESRRADLNRATGVLRAASRDSTVIAVVGRLDAVSVRALAAAHARGRSSPAYALLLDVDSWSSGRAGGAPGGDLPRVAALLRNAGWRVVVVRCGDTIEQAWRLLMAGTDVAARRTAVLR